MENFTSRLLYPNLRVQEFSALAGALLDGRTLIYPTETGYVIGCDAMNALAVERLYKIKKRDPKKAMLVLVKDRSQLDELVVGITDLHRQTMDKGWPGPLTIIFDARPGFFPESLLAGKPPNVAVRISTHPFTRRLLEQFGRPIVCTSANLSGENNPNSLKEIADPILNGADFVVDAGDLPPSLGATIVRIEMGTVKVIRQGDLSLDQGN